MLRFYFLTPNADAIKTGKFFTIYDLDDETQIKVDRANKRCMKQVIKNGYITLGSAQKIYFEELGVDNKPTDEYHSLGWIKETL